ncbi:DUF29 family protein [Musicola keenii]|uniref:DUF29 family protein n=1 Tax=Musicola keenii TaxID=2884250 RepID=UPI0017854553|nr:DUF29 family protein [Musicola keenii]
MSENPSLKSRLQDIIADAYGDAVIGAERETGLNRGLFPANCPWSFEQAVNPDFYPE